jgi:hypothetical protein
MAAKEWGRCSVRRSSLSVVGVTVPSARSPGWVYVLTNPAIPGRVKIGCTARTPEIRAAGLPKASSSLHGLRPSPVGNLMAFPIVIYSFPGARRYPFSLVNADPKAHLVAPGQGLCPRSGCPQLCDRQSRVMPLPDLAPLPPRTPRFS